MQTPSAPMLRAVLCAFLALVSASVHAAVKADILNAGDPVRTLAPFNLRIKLTHDGAGIVEGHVEAAHFDGDHLRYTQRTDPLFITPDGMRTTILLPFIAEQSGSAEVRLAFVAKDGARTELSTVPFGGSGISELVIAYVTPDRPREVDLMLASGLRLEDGVPPGEARNGFEYSTRTAWLMPGDLPAHPLGLCAYDIAVLNARAFRDVGRREREALLRWVGAGGRLVVVCPANPGETQQEFLAALRGDADLVEAKSLSTRAPQNLSLGFGKAVIIPEEMLTLASRDATAKMDFTAIRKHCWGVVGSLDRAAGRVSTLYGKWDREFADSLRAALLPSAPRPLSTAATTAMLAGFVAVVCVLDYVVLGWLRKRRLTWVFFPLCAVAFACWIFSYTNHRMNAYEHGGTLRVVDLGLDGRVLREFQHQVVLPAASRIGKTTTHGGFALPVGIDALGAGYNMWPGLLLAGPFEITGNPSGSATLIRGLEKWTPAESSITAFPDTADDSGIEWERLAVWLKQHGRTELESDGESREAPANPEAFPPANLTAVALFEIGPRASHKSHDIQLDRIADRLACRVHDDDLSAVFYQSPVPWARIIDHCLSRKRDTNIAYIVVARREGPNITAYRKLHRFAQ